MPSVALVNTNRMCPPIAPLGLDYLGASLRAAGVAIDLIDLCLAEEPGAALRDYFASHSPALIALSFRNADDSFWPSMASFLPQLVATVEEVRRMSDAPLVLGGSGFSIFATLIMERTRADFGIRGDGEEALRALLAQLEGPDAADLTSVPGLLRWEDGSLQVNRPQWLLPEVRVRPPSIARDVVDNATYFRLGGQVGLETKRGCPRACPFCADPLATGVRPRLRRPEEVAGEAEALLSQGIDVLHLCDAEFNLPLAHARAVCDEFARRGLGERLRWYTYAAVTPFDERLAAAMARAGCVGIDFTGPSASATMLRAYGQPHSPADIAETLRLCRRHGITTMVDLMLGGPGETPVTVRESIDLLKRAAPDCVGAGVGVRLYPGLPLSESVIAHDSDSDPALRRRGGGPLDLLEPVFYVSAALGPHPASVVRQLIGGDERFFEPDDDTSEGARDSGRGYNYNDNTPLTRAIADGARGAYWDILRKSLA